jgi:YD repeat-containing protein
MTLFDCLPALAEGKVIRRIEEETGRIHRYRYDLAKRRLLCAINPDGSLSVIAILRDELEATNWEVEG